MIYAKFILPTQVFFMTSKSHDPLTEVQYQVAVLPQHISHKIGTYVLVRYEGELWPGQITKVEQDRVGVKCFQKAATQGSVWRWPDKPDEGFYQIGNVEQEIETPLDIGSSSSSLRSSNFLVRVAELDYLYKSIYFMFTVINSLVSKTSRPGETERKTATVCHQNKKTITSSLAKCQPCILLNFQKHCYRDL